MKYIHTLCAVAALFAAAQFASAADLDRSDVELEVMAAEALVAQSDRLKFTWNKTHGFLKKAQEALKGNDLEAAVFNAGIASQQAQQAIAQKEFNDRTWEKFVPK